MLADMTGVGKGEVAALDTYRSLELFIEWIVARLGRLHSLVAKRRNHK
jgi:hypothetical protein